MHTLPHAHPLRASDTASHTDFLDATVPAILADATALLRVVGWPDEPQGIHVVDLATSRFNGLCRGSGHQTAAAFGLPGVAVLVNVRRKLVEVLAAVGDVARFAAVRQLVREYATPAIEAVAVHEAAHALAAAIDPPPCPVAIEAARQDQAVGIPMPTPEAEAAGHGAAWAAGAAVLYRRAAAMRSHFADWPTYFAAEFARYGLDYDAVVGLVRTIPDDEPLRPLLADPIFIARIEHAIAPHHERARVIAAKRTTANRDVPGARPTVPSGAAASRKEIAPC